MVIHVVRIFFIVLEVLVLFNLLIAVHELGHFLAARWRGLYIEQFGIWFGKPIWQKKINGVLYSLGSIPLGGFVKLPQLAPMDIIEGEADVDRAKLPAISALDKIIVAIAGPVFSLLLALTFAGIVWAVGHPVSEADMTTTIGYVMKNSPAEKAGLLAGDKILRVDGRPVRRFTGMNDSVTWNVIRSEGATIPFAVERAGQTLNFEVVPYKAEARGWHRRSVRQVMILPATTAVIAKVFPNTPAAAADIRAGDVLLSVNEIPVYNPAALAVFLEDHLKDPVVLRIHRGNEILEKRVTPALMKDDETMKPRIGIEWDPSGRMSIAHPNPIEQVYNSVSGTLSTIGAVVSPKSDVGLQHMSGPVGIGHVYYLLFESEAGWQLALWFSVLLNVNLAILNMLPIPILDGGHIVLAIVESTRRKPVNMRLLEIIQTSCAVLIFGFILYVTFFDVGDFFTNKSEKSGPPPGASTPAKPR